MCNENEELKRRLQDVGEIHRKVMEYENNINALSS